MTYVIELSWQPIVIKAIEGICKQNSHEVFLTLSSLPLPFPLRLELVNINTVVMLARDCDG